MTTSDVRTFAPQLIGKVDPQLYRALSQLYEAIYQLQESSQQQLTQVVSTQQQQQQALIDILANPVLGFASQTDPQLVGLPVQTVSGTAVITISGATGPAVSFTGSGLTFTGAGSVITVGGALGLTNGGTNANLSGTGGAHQFLRQNSAGAAIDVVRPATADLSDYAEGTFTPGVSFGGGTTGITYANQLGWYTQIGDLVFYIIRVTLTNKGSSTGTAVVTGMPINGSNTASKRAMAAFYWNNGSYSGTPIAYMDGNTSQTQLQLVIESNSGNVSVADNTNFTNTSDLNITGWYRTN